MGIFNGHLVHVVIVLESTAVDCVAVLSSVETVDKVIVLVDTVSITIVVNSVVVEHRVQVVAD